MNVIPKLGRNEMSENQERKRPFSYVRVSSLGQDAEHSLDRRRDAITAVAADLGLDIQQEYVDRDPSDNHTSAPEA